MKVRGNLLKGEPKFVHPITRQEIMKLTKLIKQQGGTKTAFAANARNSKGIPLSKQSLNNMIMQDREVLELANGDYVLVTKHTVIFKAVNQERDN